jgi:hypothetical protein
MIPMYKKGGKSPSKKKSSFMEKSKEITFGDKPDIKKSGGLYSAAEKSENIATLKKMDPSAKKRTGGSRFQEMSAKGKKGMGGMSDSTSSNDAGMSMMENEETEEVTDDKDKRARARRKAARIRKRKTNNLRKNIGKCNRGEVCFD